jgi:hypothetical protein
MAAAFRKAAKSRQREHRERSQVGPHRAQELSLAPTPWFSPEAMSLLSELVLVMTPALLGRRLWDWIRAWLFSVMEELWLPPLLGARFQWVIGMMCQVPVLLLGR